ncbi:MAG: toll/interleukin-1 receptor domain-containing protein [Pseudomonadota bacterium]
MSYDVFVVAALEDRDMAKLVTRRLRALKMRVWYDAKSTDDQFDEKEARAVHRSKSMLVLWSEAATKSDFVRAAAGTGYSIKDQPFIQAGLDSVVPYDPYEVDDLHDLKGFTSRTNTDGWFEIIQKLEGQQGRSDLREFLLIPTKDRDAQDDWRRRHPGDPLAKKGQPVGVKKGSDPALGEAALTAGAAAASTEAAAPKPAVETKSAASLAASAAPVAPIAAVDPVVPPAAERRPLVETSTTAATAAVGGAAIEDDERGGIGPIWAMLAAIAVLFVLAYLLRNLQTAPEAGAALPAIANTVFVACPAGTIPRDLLDADLLAPGEIIVDDPGN